jgi:hypothetical protein
MHKLAQILLDIVAIGWIVFVVVAIIVILQT